MAGPSDCRGTSREPRAIPPYLFLLARATTFRACYRPPSDTPEDLDAKSLRHCRLQRLDMWLAAQSRLE